MSLGTLLADRQTFVRYYNCSTYDVEYIPIEDRRKIAVGILYISLGLILEVFILFIRYILQGAVFCQQPVMMYVGGTLVCWFAGNTTTTILRQKTLVWLCVPVFGSVVFVWLVPPVIFNSIDSSAIFNPHLHYLPDDAFYHSTVHLCYNCNWTDTFRLPPSANHMHSGSVHVSRLHISTISDLNPHSCVYWGYCNSSPAIIYLCMNQTIRNSIFKRIRFA
uniref:Uncharacterized protein n=1 Tax=Ditylenchus dipsaci TaxID=166011 RepID=A0A915DN64_9BILA